MSKSEKKKKLSPAELRILKDLETADTLTGIAIKFPDPDDVKHFLIRIHPSEGIWKNGNFDFEFTMTDEYPFERPAVQCKTKLWHPNIQLYGPVCLNILREKYTPAIPLSNLILGIQYLFLEPNPNDPLNVEAAEEFTKDNIKFRVHAHDYMLHYCPAKANFD
ncbi:hypothetical protein TVAG_038730 [Trichomonas vaginalis G3]|uniref:UBC core domain-containing protein n=1 Tax=Trichomonas vaginalis (strain ATCC PRA-98 / G3) TaxID=412133 RepID=A2E5I6_TRIV3|nr:NEDD8 transferase protein [Trichomonas vaginalis G3]EAY12027.1 hypothetical protein TVAG_038730 [Trichomonas vaginalis G3]KAI5485500.1 NEDD8 transferase protein [Trichomonas vaginalis G3]|eukprot:XP_001324250.1 hypothetical protein [Trichomonas vaginalis G3]